MKIAVAGLWHLGIVTAACLVKKDFTVTGWDPDPAVVKTLSQGKSPVFEPHLNDLLAKGLQSGLLSFTSEKSAVGEADLLWVTFDTPVDDEDHADSVWVLKQIRSLLPHLKPGAGILISSQLPVGSTRELETAAKHPFCYSPENLRLGKGIERFENPDRIVAGIRRAADRAVFEPFLSALSPRIEWMKVESAEMTKHAINSFLAASVTLANEWARICESVGADAREVERGLKTDERIGPKAYLRPGAAFSGGTLARDVRFLTVLAKRHRTDAFLLDAILKSNNAHAKWAQRKLTAHFKKLKGRKIAVLGLAYKEGTDTLRRSWAVDLARWLRRQGADVQAYDWQIKQLPRELAATLRLRESPSAAMKDSDALVICSDHSAIRQLEGTVFKRLKRRLIIDPNGALDRAFVESIAPVEYCTVGFEMRQS